jgi:hypothetical protein
MELFVLVPFNLLDAIKILALNFLNQCFSKCGPQAVSEEKALQELYQTLKE